MVKGKTKSGFKFEVNEKKLTSKRFSKAYADLIRAGKAPDDDEQAQLEAVRLEDDIEVMILGEDQQMRLIEHLEAAAEDGIASNDAMQDEIRQILEIVRDKSEEVKNS